MAAPLSESGSSPAAQGSPRRFSRETALLVTCILLLLLATIPPLINLGRYQRRIASAISRSVGRPVGMDGISLRLLPWPAFQVENLVVGELPEFGAEPALRAPEVVIEPRLSSLWRGRFELSRIELSDASVNLVRATDGRWNISSVLLQASQIPNAPTAQSRPSAAPRFPYIQATGTRINFKEGVEKRPYSLLNADFSMWLARPEVWHLKLEGQPVRTDLDLSLGDTGLLRVEGELHRASAFGTMPLDLHADWNHAPMGQLSRLLLGRDAGWRGDIDASGTFQGEMNHLQVRTHLVIGNVHRQDFTPDQPLSIDATCRGLYSRSKPVLDSMSCRWPVGDGTLRFADAATGDAAADNAANAKHTLRLTAEHLPASFLVQAVGLFQAGAPSPQAFAGTVDGAFQYDPESRQLSGEAAAPLLQINSGSADDQPLRLTGLSLRAGAGPQPVLLLTADPASLGAAASPMRLSAELSARGYALHASGGADLLSLQAAGRALRLDGARAFSPSSDAGLPSGQATAQLAMTASGPWLTANTGDNARGLANVAGSLHLQNVQWNPPWLAAPISFSTLDAAVSPGTVRWNTNDAVVGDLVAPIHFAGTAQIPIGCTAPAGCPTEFTMNTATLDAGTLQAALGGNHRPLLSNILDRVDADRIRLPLMSGSVHAATLTLGRLPMHDVSVVLSNTAAETSVHAGQASATPPGRIASGIRIDSADARALGGTLHLQGNVSLAGGAPRYALQLSANGLSATQAAALWHENWGPGTLGGNADLTLTGASTGDLLGSAKGTFRASWTQGGLRGSVPRPLQHFSSWDATGTMATAGLKIEHSALSGTPATLTGSLDWGRALVFSFEPTPDETPQRLGGTLASPALETSPANE